MKFVVISIIRNEEDVIESFVRYHLQFALQIVITLHRSTDNTRLILDQLIAEGLPVVYEERADIQNIQLSSTNEMLKRAVENYDPDWIMALDADEFLLADNMNLASDILKTLDNTKAYQLPWRTFIPMPDDILTEPIAIKRMTYVRATENPQYYKCLLPRSVAQIGGVRLSNGNHSVVAEGVHVWLAECPELFVGHCPVRSPEQMQQAAIVGWLTRIQMTDYEEGLSYHKRNIYRQIQAAVSEKKEFGIEEMRKIALNYANPYDAVEYSSALVNRLMLRVDDLSFELKYTKRKVAPPFLTLLSLAEDIANAHRETLLQSVSREKKLLESQKEANRKIKDYETVIKTLETENSQLKLLMQQINNSRAVLFLRKYLGPIRRIISKLIF